jgi:hypothetical protein
MIKGVLFMMTGFEWHEQGLMQQDRQYQQCLLYVDNSKDLGFQML